MSYRIPFFEEHVFPNSVLALDSSMVLIGGQPAGSASLTLNAEQQTPWGNKSVGCITDSKENKITLF
jgi:hypothetical protein